jgi:hypothetical protein
MRVLGLESGPGPEPEIRIGFGEVNCPLPTEPARTGALRAGRPRRRRMRRLRLSAADSAQPDRHRHPGGTVPRGSGRVLYLDGIPIASQSGREVHMSEDLDRAAYEARKALLRRGRPDQPAGGWPQSERPSQRSVGPSCRAVEGAEITVFVYSISHASAVGARLGRRRSPPGFLPASSVAVGWPVSGAPARVFRGARREKACAPSG